MRNYLKKHLQFIRNEGLEKTFTDHLIPFLDRIGIMWLIGSVNPAQEHFMSNLIRQKIISEIDKQEIPVSTEKSVLMYLLNMNGTK